MKVLVLGSEGMAGHVIFRYLKEAGYFVTGLSRKNIDIESNLFLPKGYDVVVNCIGVLLPDADKDPARTVFVNGAFPHFLTTYYPKVIHISTDCVFDGKAGPYSVHDFPTERNLYGMSKALGEVVNESDLTLRVSIIGPEIKEQVRRTGLFNWVTTTAQCILSGWTNAYWNGITTLQLAKCVETGIREEISGLHHPVHETEAVTKYQLLCYINNVYGLDKQVAPTDGPKEVNKVLKTTYQFDVPTIKEQLMELKEWYSKTS